MFELGTWDGPVSNSNIIGEVRILVGEVKILVIGPMEWSCKTAVWTLESMEQICT